MTNHILSWITFFPLLGVLAILFVPAAKEKAVKWIAVGATFVPFVLSLILLSNFDATNPNPQFKELHVWIESFNINYYMGVDGISILMIVLGTMLSMLCMFASWNIKKMVKGYFAMFLLLHVGMLGVFCSLDFFLFYVFWEIMLLPMYFLVGIWGGERKEYAAIKFFLYTLAGSVFMLVGLLAIYFYTKGDGLHGEFSLTALALKDWSSYTMTMFGYTMPFSYVVWWLLFMGFAVKVPVFPFHTWLPWAHVQAPTAVSVMLAGVLLKMGTYGFLRINYALFEGATLKFSYILFILGIVNVIYGALCAMAQKDLKKLVAYSSVSHMGYVLMGMAVFTPAGISGAVLQMFNHGLSSALMFLLVGVLYDRFHHRYIEVNGKLGFGGLAQKAPVITAVWMVAVFSSLGLPGLNGFISEALVFMGSFEVYKTETFIAAIGIVLTAAYLLWMVQRVFLGPYTALKKNTATGELVPAGEVEPLRMNEWVVIVPLVILCLWIGVYPSPFLDLIKGSLGALIGGIN